MSALKRFAALLATQFDIEAGINKTDTLDTFTAAYGHRRKKGEADRDFVIRCATFDYEGALTRKCCFPDLAKEALDLAAKADKAASRREYIPESKLFDRR